MKRTRIIVTAIAYFISTFTLSTVPLFGSGLSHCSLLFAIPLTAKATDYYKKDNNKEEGSLPFTAEPPPSTTCNTELKIYSQSASATAFRRKKKKRRTRVSHRRRRHKKFKTQECPRF